MKPTGHQPPGDVRPRAARFGLGRAVAAAPAMLGSLLLLTQASVTLDRWAGLLLPLAWVDGAAVLMTGVGERMTLRAAFGFHRPSPAQAVALKAAWSAALEVTGTDAGEVELYVQTARAPNAYAAGGRSVAVTSRVVEEYPTGRLPEGQLVAVLVHELGHHATGATRPMLAPDMAHCTVARNGERVGRSGEHRGRPPPRPGTGHRRARWTGGGRVPRFAAGPVDGRGSAGRPRAHGGARSVGQRRISRRSEYAADRFAADHGLALELTAALGVLDDGNRASRGWSRLLSTHPTAEQRIKALQTTTVGLRPDGDCDRHRPFASQDPWHRCCGPAFRGVS